MSTATVNDMICVCLRRCKDARIQLYCCCFIQTLRGLVNFSQDKRSTRSLKILRYVHFKKTVFQDVQQDLITPNLFLLNNQAIA